MAALIYKLYINFQFLSIENILYLDCKDKSVNAI
jgi:hypothetical protein